MRSQATRRVSAHRLAELPRRLWGRGDISAACAEVPSADHEPSYSRVFFARAALLLADGGRWGCSLLMDGVCC